MLFLNRYDYRNNIEIFITIPFFNYINFEEKMDILFKAWSIFTKGINIIGLEIIIQSNGTNYLQKFLKPYEYLPTLYLHKIFSTYFLGYLGAVGSFPHSSISLKWLLNSRTGQNILTLNMKHLALGNSLKCNFFVNIWKCV